MMPAQPAEEPSSGPAVSGIEKAEKADVLAYLQGQLVAGGFTSKPLDISRLKDTEATKVERCLNAMLTKAATDLAHQTHLMGKYRSLASDYDRLETQITRNQSALINAEHEREQMRSKATSATKELEKEVARHNLAKEEAAKARLALSTVKSTAVLENKRRENELQNMTARWQKLSAGAMPPAASMTILNPIERIGRSDSPGLENPQVRLLEESLKNLEEARSAGQEENAQLREVIGDVVNEVQATLSAVSESATSSMSDMFGDELAHVPHPHLTLSPHLLTEYLSKLFLALRDATTNVATSAQADLVEAKTKHEQEVDERIRELEESLAVMQMDLDEAREQAQEAQAALETVSAKMKETAEVEVQKQMTEQSEETKKALEAAAELRKQRKALEQERKKASEASTRLALEQSEVEKERRALAEEKAAVRHTVVERRERQSESDPLAASDMIKGASPKKVRKAPSSNPLRQSTTTSALQSILAAGKDTPPLNHRALASTRPNVLPEGAAKSKVGVVANKTEKEDSARDRVQKALRTARDR